MEPVAFLLKSLLYLCSYMYIMRSLTENVVRTQFWLLLMLCYYMLDSCTLDAFFCWLFNSLL